MAWIREDKASAVSYEVEHGREKVAAEINTASPPLNRA